MLCKNFNVSKSEAHGLVKGRNIFDSNCGPPLNLHLQPPGLNKGSPNNTIPWSKNKLSRPTGNNKIHALKGLDAICGEKTTLFCRTIKQ
jgi:hypothetical protein